MRNFVLLGAAHWAGMAAAPVQRAVPLDMASIVHFQGLARSLPRPYQPVRKVVSRVWQMDPSVSQQGSRVPASRQVPLDMGASLELMAPWQQPGAVGGRPQAAGMGFAN